jgi:Family of unknown function (DUF6526)
MTAETAQNLARHKRYVPGFHFLTGGLILLNLVWALVQLFQGASDSTGNSALTAIALVGVFWYTRSFPMKVQDRVICLEERLRLAASLPVDFQARIPDFTPDQLIALRFASDRELADLARRVLGEHITDRQRIKTLIVTWRPDAARA